jgi:hypothetical protein
MPKASWEDLDVFLNTDEFAVPVTLQLQDKTERQINAIFDDPYLNAELGEYEFDTNRPRLTCKESDLRALRAAIRLSSQHHLRCAVRPAI